MICIPVVMKLTSIVWLMFFIYATIGVELLGVGGYSPYLNYDCDENDEEYIIYSWGECSSDTFDTLDGAFLLLL